MNPIILNEKSRFVVISYWWGRGNLNRNTQRPCPSEYEEGDRLIKKPITYDAMASRWAKNMIKKKCNYLLVEYPEFAVKGGYQNGINFKPTFIRQALEACYPRAVLYIDTDMFIKKYPHIFDIKDIDYMANGWNVDSRNGKLAVDPYVFQTSGGTQFFGQTDSARRLLDMWMETIARYPGQADDCVMAVVFNQNKMLLPTTIIQLPVEYLWLSDWFGDEINPKEYKKSRIVIEHPECLTSEEMASLQGAAKSRCMARFNRYINYQVHSRRGYGVFYEYLYFDNKRQVKSMESYINWMTKVKAIKHVPYNDKYGKYNEVATTNTSLARRIRKQSTKNIVVIAEDDSYKLPRDFMSSLGLHHQTDDEDLIALCIRYIKDGAGVIYIPSKVSTKPSLLKKMVNAVQETPNLSLVCRNLNTSTKKYKKEFMLKMDVDRPFYFGSNSDILYGLLMMTTSVRNFSSRFNSSYMFISRIRCRWI